MQFKPMTRMWERVTNEKGDSDTAYFYALLNLGEMAFKITVAGLLAGVADENERLRFQEENRLIRASGIGEWGEVLSNILTGPPSQYFEDESRELQRTLTQRVKSEEWQYEVVSRLFNCANIFIGQLDPLPTKCPLTQWFRLFVQLRNKTKGHGSPQSRLMREACKDLEISITKFIRNNPIFNSEWAYLHRNYSGKYRVTDLSDSAEKFYHLKKEDNFVFEDGVYVYFSEPKLIGLASSDVDFSDFYLANGGFTSKRYEMLSYITGETIHCDSNKYLITPVGLPASETQGLGELDVQGMVFGNIPDCPEGYVSRSLLENELKEKLLADRHEIVTLVGRGGIGKTSLALSVLHEIMHEDRFEFIVWFSARDIELLTTGPKPVKPHVLTISDIATEFARLLSPEEVKQKHCSSEEYFAAEVSSEGMGSILFVFDNLETVITPIEVFRWLDERIRRPNKVLITTRHREFKGDYPIEVRGMTDDECEKLILTTSIKMGIESLMTSKYKQSLIQESEGHPYVIKVLLGEVATSGKAASVKRIMATRENILTALFERTYLNLTPAAQRIFLTLSSWNSDVPLIALQAVLLSEMDERIDVTKAVGELQRYSFVESINVEQEHGNEELFIGVPLAAGIFGKGKLQVSPWKSAVELEIRLLQEFGATQRSGVHKGIVPHVSKFLRYVSEQISKDHTSLDMYIPILDTIAAQYPSVWFDIAQLYEERGDPSDNNKIVVAIEKYLETEEGRNTLKAWKMLERVYRGQGNYIGQLHALLGGCEIDGAEYSLITDAANNFNRVLSENYGVIKKGEKNILAKRLTDLMETRMDEADADDLSKLSWLYLHQGDSSKANIIAKKGLKMEPRNSHCLKLIKRLDEAASSN